MPENDANMSDRRAMLRKMLIAGGVVVGAPVVQTIVLPSVAGAATTSYRVRRLQLLRQPGPIGSQPWVNETPDNTNGCTPPDALLEPDWATIAAGSPGDGLVTDTVATANRVRITVNLTPGFLFVVDPPFVDLTRIELDFTPATGGNTTCRSITAAANAPSATRLFPKADRDSIVRHGARIRFAYASATP